MVTRVEGWIVVQCYERFDQMSDPHDHPKWITWMPIGLNLWTLSYDNKMLTLASNERAPLKAHMRLVFEIRDLKYQYATPVTVSRAGILYFKYTVFPLTDIGSQWRNIIGSWCNIPK